MPASRSFCSALVLVAALSAQDASRLTPASPGGAASTRSAQQELESMLTAVQEGNAVALWNWLPDSYRAEVEGMVHDLGDRVDAKLYERTMQLLARIARVGIDKREFVFASPTLAPVMSQHADQEAAIKAIYGNAMTLLRELAESDLRSVDTLRSFDGERFARQAGKPMLTALFAFSRQQGHDPIDELANTRIATLQQESDRASLELRAPGEQPKVETFVRVEGRWLPRRVVEVLPDAIAKARARIAQMSLGGDKQQTAQARLLLGTVEAFVRKFEDADSQAEFDAACEDVMRLAGRGAKPRAR